MSLLLGALRGLDIDTLRVLGEGRGTCLLRMGATRTAVHRQLIGHHGAR